MSGLAPFRVQIEGAIAIARAEIAYWERQATMLGELLEPSEPLDPPATREEILRQLRENPPGFTSLELQARLALSEAVVDGHLRALRKEGAVESERALDERFVVVEVNHWRKPE